MLVEELMHREPPRALPETPIEEAARLMRAARCRALAVCNQDAVVGIVTASDIVTRHLADDRELQFVGSLMTSLPQVIAPGDPAEVAESVKDQREIDHLPVCTDEGTLIGMLTRADLPRRFREPAPGVRVAGRPNLLDDLSEALAHLHEVRQEIERLERDLSGRRRVLVEREARRRHLHAAGTTPMTDAS
jgi:CBS domain-containing protein